LKSIVGSSVTQKSQLGGSTGVIYRQLSITMDYRAIVVADGCSDKDPEVQRVLMEKIFPFQARIAAVEAVIGALPLP
jgi:hypothetical protein